MEILQNQLQQISEQLQLLQKKLDNLQESPEFEGWMTRKSLMKFLNYGDTQIASLFKNGELKIAEIGNRKFISKESVLKMLEKNIIK
ncbi:MAG: hypothetical protein ABJB11_12955 [Ferruginibacter sp.]